MEVTLWAKHGKVSISVVGDSNPNAVPILNIAIKDPQILYDETTHKITIIETK
jgi:hypothetical protein